MTGALIMLLVVLGIVLVGVVLWILGDAVREDARMVGQGWPGPHGDRGRW